MGCSLSKKKKIAIPPPGYEDPDLLASVTPCRFLISNLIASILLNANETRLSAKLILFDF